MKNQTGATDKRHEVIHIKKRQTPFVMLDKRFLEDSRLSYKAKGLLAYLLSKPDKWTVVVKDLVNHSKDGRDAVYSGLRELKAYGYYHKEPVRNENGVITHWDSIIYEDPSDNPVFTASEPLTGNPQVAPESPPKPQTGFPDTAFPNTGMPEHSNTDNSNKSLSDIGTHPSYQYQIFSVPTKPTANEVNKKSDKIKLDKTEGQQKEIVEQIKKGQSIETQFFTPAISKDDPKPDGYDYTTVEEIIKDNIDYKDIVNDGAVNENILDEIVQVVTATICSKFKDGYISMGEAKIPVETVRNVFFKLNRHDIEYFTECFDRNSKEIKKIQAYIRTALFRNHATIEHHYSNLYNVHNKR